MNTTIFCMKVNVFRRKEVNKNASKKA